MDSPSDRLSLQSMDVRDSFRKIDTDSWLIGTKLILQRTLEAGKGASWRSGTGAWFTVTEAPSPPPESTRIPTNKGFPIVQEDEESAAVWCLGRAFLKVKKLKDREKTTKEAATLEWLAQRELSFEVPKVLYYAQDEENDYLIVSAVQGQTLGKAWQKMNISEKKQCANRVVEIVRELVQWQNDSMTGVDGAELPECALDTSDEGPNFSSEALQKTCHDLGMDCSKFVFSHNDLGPYSIMVDGDTKNIVGIIDWGLAGYVPSEWIRTKFGVSWTLNLQWRDSGTSALSLMGWRHLVGQHLAEAGYPEVKQAYDKWFKESMGV
ncbi:hypothetical protein ANO11243_077000 [Dothideomycetidae sp. 11243]|nr:hypothetical protein ANO11243_077000 [fungal sp. No.11243]